MERLWRCVQCGDNACFGERMWSSLRGIDKRGLPHAVREAETFMDSKAVTEPQRPILLVDDDIDIREALTDTLEDHGFEVITAANGLDALQLLRRMKVFPSVILLDLMMPTMDGYGFLDAQRGDPKLARIPVAIITAGHGVDRHRLGDSPPLVAKPIKIAQLVAVLRRLQSVSGPSS
jgi:CheY-like chemotaxis protein